MYGEVVTVLPPGGVRKASLCSNTVLAPLGSIDSDGTLMLADPFNSLIELVESESSGRVVS